MLISFVITFKVNHLKCIWALWVEEEHPGKDFAKETGLILEQPSEAKKENTGGPRGGPRGPRPGLDAPPRATRTSPQSSKEGTMPLPSGG